EESTESKQKKTTKVFSGTSHTAEDDDHTHVSLIQTSDGKEPPTLQQKMKNGTYIYNTKPSPQNYSGGFHAGSYTPTNLNSAAVPGVTYQSIYGSSSPLMINFDAEWQFFKSAGKLGLKGGLGLFTA